MKAYGAIPRNFISDQSVRAYYAFYLEIDVQQTAGFAWSLLMPWSSFVRCAALSLQLLYCRIGKSLTRTGRRIRGYYTKTTPRQQLSRIAGVLLFAVLSVALMGTNGCVSCNQTPTNKTTPEDDQVGHTLAGLFLGLAGFGPSPHLRPMVTGTDGSQTGMASFLGNFTGITQASGNYFIMMRTADCSLDQFTGSATFTGSFSFTGYTTNYERILHQSASLTTTPDIFAHGCVDNSVGVSSRAAVALPRKANSTVVFATAENNGSNNAVFILSSSADLSTINFVQLPGLTAASALATADLNGDGNGDLVVVDKDYNTSSAYISVIIGNGDGTFKSAVNYPIGGNMSVAAVIDDVNNDGKLDIVAVSDNQQLSVLLGNGDGTFQAVQSFAAPALPGYSSAANTPILGLITTDVNNDGKKDIVCSNGLVLLGTGTGTFNAVSTPAFPYSSNNPGGFGPGLASGDLNNDGKPDLVLDTGTNISIYLGKGDGTFTYGASYTSISNSGYVTITDLDGDGNLDIYTGLADLGIYTGDDNNNASAYALMGKGDGTFVGAPQSAGAYNGTNLGDVNGDGIFDLITNATGQFNQTLPTLTVQLGTGKGTFTSASTITAPASFTATTSALTSPVTITNANTVGPTSYAVADLNGDGKADLVFVDNGLTAINPGSGLPITYPAPIYFVALSNGDGTFATPVPYNFPQISPASGFDVSVTANTVQIADFNHDGHPDLIFTYNAQAGGPGTVPYYQGFAVLTGKGDGTFSTTAILTSTYSSTTPPTTALVSTVLSTVDLNSDGKPDLIVNAPGTVVTNFQLQNAMQIYIGNGDGTFKTPTTIPTADEYGIPVLADLNKDGKLDLAFLAETSASQAELVVALGNGDGTFAAPTVLNLTGGDSIRNASLAAADFNADGKPDLALIDSADYSGVFYGNGDGTFVSVPQTGYIVPKDLINIAAGSPAIAVDLNKDGKPDLLGGSAILLNIYGAVSTPPTLASTTTAITASSSSITTGSSIKFTATVTPAAGSSATPTGTVAFYNGAVSLGTSTVSSGVATLTTSALTTVGSDSISATYSGDTNFAGSTSANVAITVTAAQINVPNVVGLTQAAASTSITTAGLTIGTVNTASSTTVASGSVISQSPGGGTAVTAGSSVNLVVSTGAPPTPGLTLSPGSANLSFARGATSGNSTTITVSPTNGFTGSVALTAALTSSPSGAANLPTLSFGSSSPVSITGSIAGSATLTISTNAPTTGATTVPARPGTRWSIAGGVTVACMLMLGLPSRRRRLRIMLGIVVLSGIATGGIVGCGGHGNTTTNTGNPGTTPGSYTITVSASSGSTTAQTTVGITVN
jgi:hypothetical protein